MELRRKYIRIGDSVWASLLGAGLRRYQVDQGLPEDARCVGVEKGMNDVRLCFESASFEDVAEGIAPELPITISQVHVPTPPDLAVIRYTTRHGMFGIGDWIEVQGTLLEIVGFARPASKSAVFVRDVAGHRFQVEPRDVRPRGWAALCDSLGIETGPA